MSISTTSKRSLPKFQLLQYPYYPKDHIENVKLITVSILSKRSPPECQIHYSIHDFQKITSRMSNLQFYDFQKITSRMSNLLQYPYYPKDHIENVKLITVSILSKRSPPEYQIDYLSMTSKRSPPEYQIDYISMTSKKSPPEYQIDHSIHTIQKITSRMSNLLQYPRKITSKRQIYYSTQDYSTPDYTLS
uniref:Uncharacterized protein n=1 Tax=Meloidogyne floridensis TaxID=298350 RepID=A0A915P8J5_9BILA